MLLEIFLALLVIYIAFHIMFVAGNHKIKMNEEVDESIGETTEKYSHLELLRCNKYRYLSERDVRLFCIKQESTPFKTFTSRTEKNGVLVEVVSEYYPNDTLVYLLDDKEELFVNEKVEYFYTICMNIKVNSEHHCVYRNIKKAELMDEKSDLFNIIWNEMSFDIDNKELCKNVIGYEKVAAHVENIIIKQSRMENYNNIVKSIESE